MKKIILDENLPVPLRLRLQEFDVVTIQYLGWSGIQNGDLIAKIDGHFDILITGDKNLRYQQNIAVRKIAIIELPHTRLGLIEPLIEKIKTAIREVPVDGYIQIVP